MATDKSGKENSEPEGTENASETDNKISGLPSDQRGDQDEETTATASASDSQSNGLADDEASGDEHSHVKLTQEEQNDEDGAALAEQRPLLSPKDAPAEPKLSILRCIFFFIATALTAMNLAYSQPLLDLFRKEFQIGVSEAGLIATVQSVGYMVGLINVSPLGDMMEKKKIVVVAVALLAPVDASLGLIGNYHAFLAANFAMGVLIGTLSLMMSMGVEIAPPQHRGAVLGSMVSGNMFGTLGARLVSGAIADAFGYKWVYRLAAAEMVVLLIALYFGLPKTPVPARATDHDGEEGGKSGLGKFASAYWDVFTSMGTLLVKHPLLLKVCVMAFLTFTAFSTFWTTSTFLLAGPPYFLTPQKIGMLGLAGIAGILVTPVLGHLADTVPYYRLNAIGTTSSVIIWTTLLFFGSRSLIIVFAGAFFLDVATFSVTLVNRTVAFKHLPHALSRVNSIYSVAYCIGNSTGSALGPFLWDWRGWAGTAAVGIGCAVLVQALGLYQVQEERAPRTHGKDLESGGPSADGEATAATARYRSERVTVANSRADSESVVDSDSSSEY